MRHFLLVTLILIFCSNSPVSGNEVPVCGGFIEFPSDMNPALKSEIDFGKIKIESFSQDMILKEEVAVANSGHYFVILEEDDDLVHFKISGPNGMTFGKSLNRTRRILFGAF